MLGWSMKRVDFVLFYEHVPREFSSVMRLKKVLESQGLRGVIFPKHFYKYLAVVAFNPRVIVLPYLYSERNDQHLMFESVYGEIPVLNLHSEQLHDETTKAFQMPHDDYARCCFHISWGERFADALKDHGVPVDLIFKAGSIRNDDTFFKSRMKSDGFRVLIPTAFSKTFVSEEYIKKLTALDAIDEEMYLEKVEYTRKVRDCFFRDVFKLSLDNRNVQFVFRPHPYVELDEYEKVFCRVNGVSSLPSNVKVERNGSVQNDIASALKVITWYSSTALDAYLMGRDVIVYEPVETPQYMKIGFMDYFKSTSDIVGLDSFLNSPVTEINECIDSYIGEVYGDVDGRSCERVASVIRKIARNDDVLRVNKRVYIIMLLKVLYIDIPKVILNKLGILPLFKPFYKGVQHDNVVDLSLNEVESVVDANVKFKKNQNGIRVEIR